MVGDNRFIVFEGIDGAGKTTLISLLKERLLQHKRSVTVTREPGGTDLGEDLRQVLLRTSGEAPRPRTEVLLYMAARAQHVEQVIRPELERGKWVLCDRFTASSVAFQAAGRGLARADVDWLNAFAVQGLRPHLTVLLDLAVEQSAERSQGRERSTDRLEREHRDFHQAVRESYLAQARENPATWLVLDARQSPQELLHALVAYLEKSRWLDS